MSTQKTAIVTGSGRGIGAAIAKRLADDGLAVAVLDITEEAAADTAKAMKPSAMKVTVNNFSNESVATRQGDDGSLEIIIGRAVAAAEERIASGITTGSGRVSRAIESAYQVRR